MKKSLLPLAAIALIAASCSTDSKDSYRDLEFSEYNLIIDMQDSQALSQVSSGSYVVRYNMSKDVMDIKASDITVNNQAYSFETDTMAIKLTMFTTTDGKSVDRISLSKKGSVGVGSSASDLNANFVYAYVPYTNNILDPTFTLAYMQRLDMSYTLSDRYHVQTFWPEAYFCGVSYSNNGTETFSSREGGYIVQLDFKNNLATVYAFNAELSATQPSDFPKIIKMESIPVVFTHSGFFLESPAPKTTVLGKKDDQTAMVESDSYKATDFRLDITSPDLTEISVSYKIDGKTVSFRGCSILKPNMP